MHRSAARSRTSRRYGVSVIEFLLVVSVAVILAISILPAVGQQSSLPADVVLKHHVSALRTQLEIYRYNHEDRRPSQAIATQLTSRTDLSGATCEHGSCGPYFASGIPFNPFNRSNEIRVVSPLSQAALNGSAGWLYDPHTGVIVPGDSIKNYTAFDGP